MYGPYVHYDNYQTSIRTRLSIRSTIPDELLFDMGPSDAPVEPGYTPISEAQCHQFCSAGWLSTTSTQSRNRSFDDPLLRDLVISDQPATFRVSLANGGYQVTVRFMDADYHHDLIQLAANGRIVVPPFDLFKGEAIVREFKVAVTEEKLDLKFSDQGGTNEHWVVNAVEIVPDEARFPQGGAGVSRSLPTKAAIIDSMKLCNEHWISEHPDPGDNDWARAVYFEGNMAMYDVYPVQGYYNYAVGWGERHDWGLRGGTSTRHADNHAAGQAYLAMYRHDPQPERIEAITTSIENMLETNQIEDWWWVDALHMAMPVFAGLGTEYNDTRYHTRMHEMFTYTKSVIDGGGLWNATEHLWYRDGRYNPPAKTRNGELIFWSRGNGWAVAALVRTMSELSNAHSHYKEYLTTFQNMAAALALRQRSDGFWNVSLNDPLHYPGPETSGTAFFTYALAWGILNGYLDAGPYTPVVASAWNGMVSTALHSDGFLGYVQGVGERPGSSQPVTYGRSADFGVGAFLLAGSTVVQIAPGTMPVPEDPPRDVVVHEYSSYQDPNVPDNTLDGDLSTRWSDEGDAQWISYNLGEARTVEYIKIAFFRGNRRITTFDVQLSLDNTNWTTVLSSQASSGSTTGLETFDFADTSAQYVKIISHGNTENRWNSYTEVEIWGA
jgi:rhamnogalacturonyl hydrolase YesR